jgi:hypothetical protein
MVVKKKKIKEIKLPMEYIPGRLYQPILPLRNVKTKIKINWKLLIKVLIIVLILGTIYFWFGLQI